MKHFYKKLIKLICLKFGKEVYLSPKKARPGSDLSLYNYRYFQFFNTRHHIAIKKEPIKENDKKEYQALKAKLMAEAKAYYKSGKTMEKFIKEDL